MIISEERFELEFPSDFDTEICFYTFKMAQRSLDENLKGFMLPVGVKLRIKDLEGDVVIESSSTNLHTLIESALYKSIRRYLLLTHKPLPDLTTQEYDICKELSNLILKAKTDKDIENLGWRARELFKELDEE